jgi:methylmalonyl-CoA mutase N-terminal domain/subunit
LGGTQSLHTNSYDEAYATPSEEAVTVALRTQQVLGYESGITDSVDPLGGSYFIESLTNAIEKEASHYIERIDQFGSALQAIEQGFQQREIQESSYRSQKDTEEEKRIVVGVNKFVSPYPEISGLIRVDPEEEKKQRKRLAQVKKEREQAKVTAALKNLEETAKGNENTMPAFLECVEAYASIGEMCDVLRRVFGVQKEFLVF